MQRFSFSFPINLQGVEEYFPKELQEGVMEQNRRTIQNLESLINSMRQQLIADPDILPTMENGSSEESQQQVMLTQDVEDAKVFSMLWNL